MADKVPTMPDAVRRSAWKRNVPMAAMVVIAVYFDWRLKGEVQFALIPSP